ncbi:MAG: sigma E protease regulator RseP [Hahellaceae bacterium]|nr:sigma E protease regulator RseP [Hahellaceae bacterium]
MELLQHIFSLVVTLGILVTIHEFGHFWVARRCGVRVLRFSVGFGKPLFVRKDRYGTEFAVAAIPLGGYVKMLDEREGPVATAELPYAFNRKPVGQRIAIVAAGPLANFLFAILAYWLMFILGFSALVPRVGEIRQDSPAAVAGIQAPGEIVAIDSTPVATWQEVGLQLLSRLGDSGEISLSIRSLQSDVPDTFRLPIHEWLSEQEAPDPIVALGLMPYRPPVPAIIGDLAEGEAAITAGLQRGDRIIQVGDHDISDWHDFVKQIQASAGTPLEVVIERDQQQLIRTVIPGTRVLESGKQVGFIGAGVAAFKPPEDMIREISYDALSAVPKAIEKTWDDTVMTLVAIRKMVKGLVSVKNLSGPITIAKVASASISSGLEDFLRFLALLSVSLGVLNLLPVPVLDGGHLLYYAIELVKGKPLSERLQMFGLRIGVALILMLMVVAFYNDLSRL